MIINTLFDLYEFLDVGEPVLYGSKLLFLLLRVLHLCFAQTFVGFRKCSECFLVILVLINFNLMEGE